MRTCPRPWSITREGGIFQGQVTLGHLSIAQPPSLDSLTKVGDNLFGPVPDAQPVPFAERSVRQGHLELSGVNPTLAMMEMIETSRAFEANTHMIKNQDHMISALIERVLQG